MTLEFISRSDPGRLTNLENCTAEGWTRVLNMMRNPRIGMRKQSQKVSTASQLQQRISSSDSGSCDKNLESDPLFIQNV